MRKLFTALSVAGLLLAMPSLALAGTWQHGGGGHTGGNHAMVGGNGGQHFGNGHFGGQHFSGNRWGWGLGAAGAVLGTGLLLDSIGNGAQVPCQPWQGQAVYDENGNFAGCSSSE